MTTRRSFLGAILAAAASPVIVRAESLMKVYVPPEPKLILPQGDWTIETWMRTPGDAWQNIAACVSGSMLTCYVNGHPVPDDHPSAKAAREILIPMIHDHDLASDYIFTGETQDLRITKANRYAP